MDGMQCSRYCGALAASLGAYLTVLVTSSFITSSLHSYGGAILNASEEMRQLPDAGELTLKGRLEAR